jgi:hypothetical protein
LSRGISTSMFLRLCSRAPLTMIFSMGHPHRASAREGVRHYIMGTFRSFSLI